jgi:hypothetical protein
MKRLIICPQSKGGIGKSTGAIFTSQYLTHTLTAAIESKEYHPLERSNLRRLLRSIYAEFDKAQGVLLP